MTEQVFETESSKVSVEKQQSVQAGYGENRTVQVETKGSKSSVENQNTSEVPSIGKGVGSCQSFEGNERKGSCTKDRALARSESARAFRSIPYSPSMMLGMKKGVDCMGKKPIVIGSDEESDLDHKVANIFISPFRTIKKVVEK